MVICLEQGADLHMAQLMPVPLIASCFTKIQIGFTSLVPAHLGSPRKKEPLNGCMCVCVGLLANKPVHYYAARKLILILPSHRVDLGTVRAQGPLCEHNVLQRRQRRSHGQR